MKHIIVVLACVLFAWVVGFAVGHAISAYDFNSQITVIGTTAVLTALVIAFIVHLTTRKI